MPEPATYAELQPSMPDDAFIDARPSQSQVRGSSETRVLVVRRRVVLVRLVHNRSSKPKPQPQESFVDPEPIEQQRDRELDAIHADVADLRCRLARLETIISKAARDPHDC